MADRRRGAAEVAGAESDSEGEEEKLSSRVVRERRLSSAVDRAVAAEVEGRGGLKVRGAIVLAQVGFSWRRWRWVTRNRIRLVNDG